MVNRSTIMPHTKQWVVCSGLNPKLQLILAAVRVIGYKYCFFFQKGLLPVRMLDGVAALPHRLPESCLCCVQQLTKGVLCLQQRCYRVWLSFCTTAFVKKTCSSKAKVAEYLSIALCTSVGVCTYKLQEKCILGDEP
ncbi:uncharacterized protein M8220_003676 isoform 2-T6 [Acridotheres tristis]